MTSRGPKVQDFTSTDSKLAVHISTSPSYEFLLSLFVYEGKTDESPYAGTSGVTDAVTEHASPELKSALDNLAECGCGLVWLSLIGNTFEEASARESIDGLLRTVAESDPVELRRRMLVASGYKAAHGFDPAVVDRAAGGDAAALDELLDGEGKGASLRPLLELEPEATRQRMVDVMSGFYEQVWPHLDDVTTVLERDAAEKRTLAQTMSPERLVDTATNGVTFERAGWMTGVLLIPSAVVRPWVLLADHKSLQIFCYPITDEHLSADPSAPPEYLLEMFKALADEKRLRIMRVIDGGVTQLRDIAERVDLAKSTAHHHLRVLRTAGLVRTVVTEGGSRYEIRREAIPETGLLLNAFLPGEPDPTTETE